MNNETFFKDTEKKEEPKQEPTRVSITTVLISALVIIVLIGATKLMYKSPVDVMKAELATAQYTMDSLENEHTMLLERQKQVREEINANETKQALEEKKKEYLKGMLELSGETIPKEEHKDESELVEADTQEEDWMQQCFQDGKYIVDDECLTEEEFEAIDLEFNQS